MNRSTLMTQQHNTNEEQSVVMMDSNMSEPTRLSIAVAPRAGDNGPAMKRSPPSRTTSTQAQPHLATPKRCRRTTNGISTAALAAELMKTNVGDLKASLMAGNNSSSSSSSNSNSCVNKDASTLHPGIPPSRAALALKILRQTSSRNNLKQAHRQQSSSSNNNGSANACMTMQQPPPKSPTDRRLEIASMLERATQFAHVVEQHGSTSNKFRHCASTPLLSPRSSGGGASEQACSNHGNQGNTNMDMNNNHRGGAGGSRRRYRRRNSFVIHRDKPGFGGAGLLGGGGSLGFANATFDTAAAPQPQAQTTPNHQQQQQQQWPLGLNQQESHLVLTHMSSSSSSESSTVAEARNAATTMNEMQQQQQHQ